MKPILQIVHVTDLHVKSVTANILHPLSGPSRVLQRILCRTLKSNNLFGWEEGTQGHYPRAPRAFEAFLKAWRAQQPEEWKDKPTWLVDTGDLSAFGDPDSIKLGWRILGSWSAALGNCATRSVYGNHDAWPHTQPFLRPTLIPQQRREVESYKGWSPNDWITRSLCVPIPGSQATIRLTAINTVCWGSFLGAIRNTRAVGEIKQDTLTLLEKCLTKWVASGESGFRILALHHPLSYPWLPSENAVGPVSTMQLLNDKVHAERLGNRCNLPAGLGPWFHLFLSGHTHQRYPADRLEGSVESIQQQCLEPTQLQLVGGSLMLNKSIRQTRDSALLNQQCRDVPGFSHSSVDPQTCQSQILQFYDTGNAMLLMTRIPVYSVDGGQTYAIGQDDQIDTVEFRYDDAN